MSRIGYGYEGLPLLLAFAEAGLEAVGEDIDPNEPLNRRPAQTPLAPSNPPISPRPRASTMHVETLHLPSAQSAKTLLAPAMARSLSRSCPCAQHKRRE